MLAQTGKSPSTLVMVRTVCCEGYKQCGRRCAICPNRPENRAAVENYRHAVADFACSCDCSEDCSETSRG